jgi:hypothetical protein
MSGAASAVPDYLPQLIYRLIKEGAPHSAILRFRAYWRSLPPQRRDAPCPFCFDRGIDAPLVAIGRRWLRDHLQCAGCKRTFDFLDPAKTRSDAHAHYALES